MKRSPLMILATVVVLAALATACAKKPAPVARPQPPAGDTSAFPPTPPAPPRPVDEPIPVPPEPDSITAGNLSDDLDTLNRSGILKPVFFPLDSSEVDAEGQKILQENAELMRRNPRWQITIEGHCDERGTAEYNLALGERRALSARTYLLSLGIPGERVRTVSYGKEFPFEQGHDEAAWSKNRRAHFVITAK